MNRNRSCDTCYNYIMKSGLVPHLICLEEDEHPDIIKEQMRHNGQYGQYCPYWHHKIKIMGNTIRNGRY